MANKERLLSASKLVIALAKKYRSGMIHYDDLMATIADIPTVDAVEVVRCKNCEYHISDVGIGCLCSYFGKYMRFEDFCSYGERRSDG